jgi:2,3-bisphosphoglycerate-dependent phosphoglycerate mutase
VLDKVAIVTGDAAGTAAPSLVTADGSSRLVLVRHCAAESQAPEATLTPEGALAAQALADVLLQFEPSAVYSSPYVRAIATVAPFVQRTQHPVQIDPRLCERRLSADPRADWLELLQRSHADIDHRAPGGESLREVRARALAALADIARRYSCAVVVSHGQWLASVLSQIDPSFGYAEWRALRNPDVFVVHFRDDLPLRFERVVQRCAP